MITNTSKNIKSQPKSISKNNSVQDDNMNDEDELVAYFDVETHTYRKSYYDTPSSSSNNNNDNAVGILQVHIKSAMSSKGRHLIVPGSGIDSTGIMIWPASHLLCQFLTFQFSLKYHKQELTTNFKSSCMLGDSILELGCGCGIVGITAALTIQQEISSHIDDSKMNSPPVVIVSTDMDHDIIQLCKENIDLNQTSITSHHDPHRMSTNIYADTLTWGDEQKEKIIRNEYNHGNKFDTIIGADIVYPDTSEEVLRKLFKTVDAMMKYDYKDTNEVSYNERTKPLFLLSFVTRDGYKTPLKFINAANEANFRIDMISMSTFVPSSWSSFLPPLLDARILMLSRDENAAEHNNKLGYDDCIIFPGLREAIERAAEESSVEEWDAPFCSSSVSDNDEDF